MDGAHAWLRTELASALAAAGVGDPDRMVATIGVRRRFAGRGHPALIDLPRSDAPPLSIVVRAYRRGGVFRWLVPTRFLLGDRARREIDALEAAAAAGVATARAVAAVRRGGIVGYRAWLVTEETTGARDLLERLRERAAGVPFDPRGPIEAVGRALRRLHDAGVSVPDLHVKNVLVPDARPDEPVLIDFDGARVLARPMPESVRIAQLFRFDRSLDKAARRGARITRVERARLVRGYLDGERIDVGVRRRTLDAYRKHLARHRAAWRLTGR